MSDSLSWRDGGSGDGAFAGAVWRPPPGKRGAFLHARLVETGGRGVRVRRLGASRAGEIRLTRFLRNPAVTVEEMAAEVGAKAARVTVIADRESDIFAAFALRPAATELVVRAAQDRSLGDGGRLFGRADALAEGGRARLRLPAKPGRTAREALVAVRFMAVELARPTDGVRTGLPKSVVLNLVDVREVDPPAGEGVHWRLLTTLPVADAAEAGLSGILCAGP